MTSVFLTGFPGFLGSALIERLLARYTKDVRINCLVQARYWGLAEQRVRELAARDPAWAGRLHLIEGDLTLADLGLGADYDRIADETVEIYHLAAWYDLAVKLDDGMRVNVDGTHNMLALAKTCGPHLKRFHYVSTAYVSGRYDGTFTEDDLVCGQDFNNYYEETKYLAELEVQLEMARGLPATIYRPASVVGDSKTGETQKYDGPYGVIRWVLKNRNFAIVPKIGDASKYEVNFAPRDFVIDAIAYLSGLEVSEGKVYQLTDPSPLSVDAMITLLGEATGARVVRVPLPFQVVRRTFELPPVQNWTGIEAEAVDYFVHTSHYSCDHTVHDLRGSGISCPGFPEYADKLVQFMIEHPEISPNAMV